MKIEWFEKSKTKGLIKFKTKLYGIGCYRDVHDTQWDVRGIVKNDKNKYVMARKVDNSFIYSTADIYNSISETGTDNQFPAYEKYSWKPYNYEELS